MSDNRRSPFRLMLVTDRSLAPAGRLPALVEQAVAGGVDAVQLREKDLAEEELVALGRDLRAVTRGRSLLLVNGSVDVARACGADGVHLAEGAYLTPRPPSLAGKGESSSTKGCQHHVRQNQTTSAQPTLLRTPPSLAGKGAGGLGPFLVGRSVHDLAAARRADEEGADYLVLGTVFPSRSHPGGRTGGLELVQGVCGAVDLPVIAIGGITTMNAATVIEAGASGVAVISAILAAPDPRAAAAALRRAIEAAGGRPMGVQA